MIDIILCLIAIKTITATKKVLNIIYGFKDNKQIISPEFHCVFFYSDVNKLHIFLVNLFNKFHEENSFT
jgi:hypothetical protein